MEPTTRRKRREVHEERENSMNSVVEDVSLPTDTNTKKATRKRQHPLGVGTTTIIVTATTILTHLLVIKPFTTNALAAVAYSDNLVYARIQPDAFPDVDRIDLYQSRGTRPSAYFNRLARLVRPQPASSSFPSNPDDVSNVSTTTSTTTTLPPQHNQPQSTKIKLNHVLRFTAPLPLAQLTLSAGDALVLECSAAGTPAPVIHWLRDGKHFWPPKVLSPAPTASDTTEEVEQQTQQDEEVKLRSSGEHAVDMLSISSTNARMRLPCVDNSGSDGDGGDSVVTYACVAETSYMRKSAETVVTVVGNKNCTTTQSQPETSSSASETPADSQPRTQRSVIARHQRMMSDDGGSALGELYRRLTRSRTAPQPTKNARQQQQQPAQMYMWTGNLMELNGNDARLMCRANGSPAPTITWTTPLGHVVERSAGSSGATSGSGFPKYEVLRSGDLIVRELDFGQDMGTFYCTAKNSAGSEQVEMFVYPTTVGEKTRNE